MVFQTNRLYFRQMIPLDFHNLRCVLQDRAALYTYGDAFTDEEIRRWLSKQLDNYRRLGFGIWGIIKKDDGEFIGQGGLLLQKIAGRKSLETSYLIKHAYWHMGFSEEIIFGINCYALDMLKAPLVTAVVPGEDLARQKAAKNVGMKMVAEPQIGDSVIFTADRSFF